MQLKKFINILIVILILFESFTIILPTSSGAPTGIIYQVPVYINNTQSSATPGPFQQMVKIPISTFSSYLYDNNTTANFEFYYANNTIIPAWIESVNGTTIVIWLKLYSISADTSIQIYLGFASKTTNLLSNSGTTGIGEAPQLSPTYAQYDDGASMFNFYDNFAGTSLNTSKWTNNTANSGGTLTINNGMSYTPPSSENVYPFIYSTSTFSSGVFETYGDIPSSTQSGPYTSADFGLTTSSNVNNNAAMVGKWGSDYDLITSTSSGSQNTLSGLSGGNYIWQVWIPSSSPSTIYGSQNYGTQISSSSDMPTLPQPIIFFDQANTGINIGPFYWARVRAYPPNGVMPSVSFGGVS